MRVYVSVHVVCYRPGHCVGRLVAPDWRVKLNANFRRPQWNSKKTNKQKTNNNNSDNYRATKLVFGNNTYTYTRADNLYNLYIVTSVICY